MTTTSSSHRFCMAVWFVLSSAAIGLIGVFVGIAGILMNVSGSNETESSLYGDRLYEALSPIDVNLNRVDQVDMTLIFGRWQLHSIMITLGWILVGCAILSILLPICRPQPTQKRREGFCESIWLLFLAICITIYSVYALVLVILIILYYVFRESANLSTIDYMNNYAFGEHYAGDMASSYRSVPEVFSFTLLINYIQRTYSCCGFTSYRDYAGGAARLWSHQNLEKSNPATLPLVCCADLTEDAHIKNITLDNCRADIASGVYRANNWNTVGCYDTLIEDIGQKAAIWITASLSMLVIILSAAVVSGSLLIDMERSARRRMQSSSRRYRSHAIHNSNRQRVSDSSNTRPHDSWQRSPSYSEDDEFYYPNKIYGHRF